MNKTFDASTDPFQIFHNGNYFPNRAYGNVHSFYLSGAIEEPEKYINWFDSIRNAQENDVIYIIINSGGGNLDTALQFLKVMAETPAQVVASVEGYCMSAATMIFLAADGQEIFEHAMFMFHNYSGGTVGKGGEMADQIEFERKWSQNFMNWIYKDFLSNEEVERMMDGKDYWMTAHEVKDRLLHRMECSGEGEEAEEAIQEETPQPTPKDSPKARRKRTAKPSTD